MDQDKLVVSWSSLDCCPWNRYCRERPVVITTFGLLVGASKFTFGRRKIQMIDVGSVLRLRDGVRCGDGGLSYTRSVA